MNQLPDLPQQPNGFWAYIYDSEQPPEGLCASLERYLDVAVDICGASLVENALYDEHSIEEYFEHLSEFKRRRYDECVTTAQRNLGNVVTLREHDVTMLERAQTYEQEDSAIYQLNVALAELYNYLILPYEDSRELAECKCREAQKGKRNPTRKMCTCIHTCLSHHLNLLSNEKQRPRQATARRGT